MINDTLKSGGDPKDLAQGKFDSSRSLHITLHFRLQLLDMFLPLGPH